jgi:hypothetical protein
MVVVVVWYEKRFPTKDLDGTHRWRILKGLMFVMLGTRALADNRRVPLVNILLKSRSAKFPRPCTLQNYIHCHVNRDDILDFVITATVM